MYCFTILVICIWWPRKVCPAVEFWQTAKTTFKSCRDYFFKFNLGEGTSVKNVAAKTISLSKDI